jgi:hypothetical protein
MAKQIKTDDPIYGHSLGDNAELCRKTREWTNKILKLQIAEPVQ